MTDLDHVEYKLNNWAKSHAPDDLLAAFRELIAHLRASQPATGTTVEAEHRAMVGRVMRESNARMESIIADPTADPQDAEANEDARDAAHG